MRISHAVFVLTILCSPALVCAAQSSANGAPAPGVAPAPLPPSGLLQPSLDTLQQTVGALRLEKWKRGTVREEAGDNISSIQRDLQTTLPPLLQEADAAPGTISKALPVFRNIDALYDVLLRVVEASRVSAPGEQITQLQQAMISLGNARHALADRLQDDAAAQEKQLGDLRTALRAASVHPPAPATPTCVAPTPPRKPRKKAKPPATAPQKQPSPAATTPKT